MSNDLTIQKTLEEFKATKADYALPNSDVDIGNMYFYVCRFEEELIVMKRKEIKLRQALDAADDLIGTIYNFYPDIEEFNKYKPTMEIIKEALTSEYPDNAK